MVNVTLVTGNETITYETTVCLATCIGWNYDDEPPVHEDDLMSRGNLVGLFAVLTAFRLLCLGIEVAALTKAQEKFNELTRSSSSGSSVTPVLGSSGATKPFAELTKEELRAWMVEAKFGSYAEGFDKIEAHMLVGVTEDDIKDFGNLPAVFRRNAASAIQKAVEEGVEVGKGAAEVLEEGVGGVVEEGEGEGGMRKLQTSRGAQLARSAAGAAQKQASRMTDEAASVFTRVNTAFLVFSFVIALESVLAGLRLCALTPTREGITVTLNGVVVFENSFNENPCLNNPLLPPPPPQPAARVPHNLEMLCPTLTSTLPSPPRTTSLASIPPADALRVRRENRSRACQPEHASAARLGVFAPIACITGSRSTNRALTGK
jgi:hypothetical protein